MENNSFYHQINHAFTWKRIILFNILIILGFVFVMSFRLSQTSTENRTKATSRPVAPVTPNPTPTPLPNYPSEPPQVDRVSYFFGKPGDSVLIYGKNFGDLIWRSRVNFGNVDLVKDSIVRWSNTILEVKVPSTTSSGMVQVTVNGKTGLWDGHFSIYSDIQSAQIGLQPLTATSASLFISNAVGATSGKVELSYSGNALIFNPAADVHIADQLLGADSLGRQFVFHFTVPSVSTKEKIILGNVFYPSGNLEIIQAELNNFTGRPISTFADPLSIKIIQATP